jgi:hypothetical protein
MTTEDAARLRALGIAALLGALVALAVHRTAPPPAADVSRGSEDAFVTGLHAREIPPRGTPLRWTRDRTVVSFRHLPPGDVAVEVQLRGQRAPVVVAADGVVLGTVDVGARSATFAVPPGARALREVELRSTVFAAGGRDLGAMFERVTVRASRAAFPPMGLVALFAVTAVVAAGMALVSGARPWMAIAAGGGIAALQGALLWPSGAVHSPYAVRLAVLLGIASIGCGLWGAWWGRRNIGAGPWAFVALLVAVVVQVVVGASPLMVVSDAVFHSNNLVRVASGNLFLTSQTQHATPFRFPYGVSFYVLLAPLLRLGLDPVALVRWGAALAGVAGAAALFGLLASARGPALAALAVVLLQMTPVTIDVMSFGNLSNAFGQGLTLVFFAWWAGRARGSWLAGALVLALAATAHLSCFIVLMALAPWLVWAHGTELRHDRTRAIGLVLGLGAAVAYFASFAPMVTAQLARLGEGAGPSGGGVIAAVARQGMGLMGQWGLPVLALAVLGLPRSTRDRLDRDLVAWWVAASVLLVLALVSPLDVRWIYALGPVAAVAAATGFARRWHSARITRIAGLVLLAVQAALAAWTAAVAIWLRYR